jgi:type IV secretion system protein VirD4
LSFLSLYRDPTVAAVTSECDWRIADLLEAERPVSLYLVVPPSDLSRTKPLVRLILNQIGRRLTEQLPLGRDKDRRQLLLMLDEFPALGRLDFFETALAFLAGYGVRAFLIAQSLNQIVKAYGENNSVLDNCHVRVAFATNDERTAKRISDALGTATEQRAMRNYAGHRLSPWLGHVMVSRQETSRPLLTPGEVMQLPQSDELVLVSGLPPVRAKKLRYFDDGNFSSRVLPAPALAAGGYVDCPKPRGHDWIDRVRTLHPELKIPSQELPRKDEDALDQQHELEPQKEEEPKLPEPKPDDGLGMGPDDDDPTLGAPLSPGQTAFGIQQGKDSGDDMTPEL